jgi:hypothetical protein
MISVSLTTHPTRTMFNTYSESVKETHLNKAPNQLSTNDMKAMTPHNPPLTNVTIDDTTDPQTNGATVNQ